MLLRLPPTMAATIGDYYQPPSGSPVLIRECVTPGRDQDGNWIQTLYLDDGREIHRNGVGAVLRHTHDGSKCHQCNWPIRSGSAGVCMKCGVRLDY